MKLQAAPVVAAVALAGGCGDGPGAPEPGVIQLRSEFDPSGGAFIEGFRWKLEVKGVDGGGRFSRAPRAQVARLRVPPGRYRVASWVEPCDGTCANLDPPQDRCTGEVAVESAETVRRTVRITAGRPCRILR